ncbi:hypothetical protein TNCV_3392231 [Trichonephila clavipes]|nr:hypothetical protein TNCV_3392231 [Trichonephila clavipes]
MHNKFRSDCTEIFDELTNRKPKAFVRSRQGMTSLPGKEVEHGTPLNTGLQHEMPLEGANSKYVNGLGLQERLVCAAGIRKQNLS